MKNNFSKKRNFWGLLSIISPFLGFMFFALWAQENESFWITLGPEDSAAGAMMGFSEVIIMIVSTGFASIFGMLFGFYGLRKINLGSKVVPIIGLSINIFPISLLLFMYLK